MKKILAALLVLALVAPAFAVSITGTDAGAGKLRLSYSVPAGEVLRGVALNLNTTTGTATIANTAVVTSIASGFNTFIDYAFTAGSGYTLGTGHPLAKVSAPGALDVFPASQFVLSMGALDTTGAQGGVTGSGVLCDIQYNVTGAQATVTVSADPVRGGAVVGDAVTQPTPIPFQVILNNACTVSKPTLTKTTAGTSVKNTAGTVGDPARVNSGRTETFVAVATSTLGHGIEYNFSWGDTTSSGWVSSGTQTHVYTYGGAGVSMPAGYTYNVTVQARCTSPDASLSPVSDAFVCTSEAVKSTATFYAAWAQYNRPICWAYPRNCKGDVDGLKQGSVPLGYTWVSTNDLSVLLAAYGIKEPTKGIGIMNIPGYPNAICADFARDQQGSVPLGYSRVSTNDLSLFLPNYNIKEPTKGPGIGICVQTNYHYWTGAL